MFVYGLTRKQCGVIFANIKSGRLNLADDFSKWMYNNVADAKAYADNSHLKDVFARMRNGLEAIFAGNIAEAEQELNNAYNVYHAFYA